MECMATEGQKGSSIKLFEDKHVRTAWDEEKEEWFFSVVDVVGILTENEYQAARNYWKVLKSRLSDEGSQLVTDCNQLKMKAHDGKMRLTDVASTEQILRIIQSIPSPKAEPFKAWLATVGRERLDETADPELAISRALDTYRRKGHPDEWIRQRLQTIKVRRELTDEWGNRGVKGNEYAFLTDEIYEHWAGMKARQYKSFKGLKKENLRDNMSSLELALNTLAEATTAEVAKARDSQGYVENRDAARRGGRVAGNARREIEEQTGRSVITSGKAAHFASPVSSSVAREEIEAPKAEEET